MAKAVKKTTKPKPKKKADKYQKKINIEGSFDEVMNILTNPTKKQYVNWLF